MSDFGRITIDAQIVRIERGETSNSRSPMWRCTCSDGNRVNVFKHTDANKNSFALLDQAGYGALLMAMALDEIQNWKNSPITVKLTKPGLDAKFWDVAVVIPMADGAEPDAAFSPSPALYRQAVELWASHIVDPSTPVVCLDTETTGLTDDDEIVDVCVRDFWGGELFGSLIKPSAQGERRLMTPDANGFTPSELTGITPEMFLLRPNFIEAYDDLANAINGKIVVIYNAAFDMRMLERQCARLRLPPFAPLAVVCAMEKYAQWHGIWNPKLQKFMPVTLSDACANLGVEIQPHRAVADVKATIALIFKLADLEHGDDVD